MPAPLNVVGIDHIVLCVVNATALERFYLDALGLSFESGKGNERSYVLETR